MTRKEERILSELYPGVSNFTDEQVAFAHRAIEICNRDAKRSRIPRTDIGIGETFFRKGKQYRCIPRRRVGLPCEACSGCAFNQSDAKCAGLRCSKFDRSDGNNVWFEEVV